MKPVTRSDAIIITYAHCRKWSKGQLDCHPHSDYALMHLAVELQSTTHALGDVDWKILVNNECIGVGQSADEAIQDAQWTLMNESRRQALQASVEKEGAL